MRRALVVFAIVLCLASALTVDGASARTKAAGIVSASNDPSTAASETLLSSIAAGDRERCYQRDKDTMANGDYAASLAAVQCDNPADGVDAVVYVQYGAPDAVASRFAAIVPSNIQTTVASSATSCDGSNAWHYNDNADGGSYACWVDSSGQATMAWTATGSNILGLAGAADGPTLKAWWNKSSGPLEQPDTVTNFGTGTRKEYLAATKSLLADEGKAVSGCKSQLDLVAPGDVNWAWFPWVLASEGCSGPQHATINIAKMDPKSSAAYEQYVVKNVIVSGNNTSTPKACASQDITDKKHKVVGAVRCVYSGENLFASWYTTDTGVVGTVELNTTPKKLFAYLNQHELL